MDFPSIIMENHNTDLMKKLFTAAFFVAKNEKPYTDFVKLTDLQAANYGDEILTKHYNGLKEKLLDENLVVFIFAVFKSY